MEEWNSGIYGNGKAEDAYKEATGFWSESAGQMTRKQTDDKKYRSILVFGTQESNCYAGPLFVTGIEDDTEDRVIVALDFKKTFRKENIDFAEVEYWVYYKNLAQDIDHQIANSPIYCDPREAHKYGSGMWSGPVGEMVRKEITAGYANECLGIAFEFFPPENANSSNIFKVNNTQQELWKMMEKLYPIPRTLMGDEFEKSLGIIEKKIPMVPLLSGILISPVSYTHLRAHETDS